MTSILMPQPSSPPPSPKKLFTADLIQQALLARTSILLQVKRKDIFILFWWSCHGLVVMASGWESKSPGFNPRHLKATFGPELPKKPSKYSQSECAFNEKIFILKYKILGWRLLLQGWNQSFWGWRWWWWWQRIFIQWWTSSSTFGRKIFPYPRNRVGHQTRIFSKNRNW